MDKRWGVIGLLALAGMASAAGCGTTADFTQINSPPFPLSPRSPGQVHIFSSGPPRRSHVDVAVIRVEQTHGLNEQGAALMIHRIREQAGAIGCDAVVLGGSTDHNGAQPGTGLYLLDPGSTIQTATCIVYDDADAGPPVHPFRRRRSSRAADADDDSPPPTGNGVSVQQEDAEDP